MIAPRGVSGNGDDQPAGNEVDRIVDILGDLTTALTDLNRRVSAVEQIVTGAIIAVGLIAIIIAVANLIT